MFSKFNNAMGRYQNQVQKFGFYYRLKLKHDFITEKPTKSITLRVSLENE